MPRAHVVGACLAAADCTPSSNALGRRVPRCFAACDWSMPSAIWVSRFQDVLELATTLAFCMLWKSITILKVPHLTTL
ncbi:hypothetical protein PF005_g15894 [Phytophthora fragariae]|uniref:Uncharacterized protein n=1 Tax=Phytophthora fragariae TaxID=53985 RepID=A0A6A3YSN8_9STRA|nr:hypothetical protein PF003_g10574 [Phytophthora fragariae]KAE8935759.1 hypothetical protein PF009_g14300 [Phytophthora fragariae]KAE9000888.1 hypothetical protein PF011_g13994 [Phytophthora fragariae]KAE9087233.1 hypothetical protein PF010_g19803 [Phytophthora fragariae]KAE9106254.1 hypothetical protein PF007_g13478 [Phytophthora fragariae]